MTGIFKAACLQTNSARDIAPNLPIVADLARRARDAGAEFITTPECVGMLEPKNRLLREKVPREDDHAALQAFRELAREMGAWFLIGSIPVKLDGGKIANRGYLLDGDGGVRARYDKIHMFDVDLGGGEVYRESNIFEPGRRAVLAETPWGRLGMTICYDLRFPGLYRQLAQQGAEMLSVPSAFTRPTGRAHWHVLNQARAIENGCYLLAPAQCGVHAEGRETYGHSLIIDPWGEVLADGGEDVGFIIAELDPAKVAKARAKLPSLGHDREFSLDPEKAEHHPSPAREVS